MSRIYAHEQRNHQFWRGEWERVNRTSSDQRARARAAAVIGGAPRGR